MTSIFKLEQENKILRDEIKKNKQRIEVEKQKTAKTITALFILTMPNVASWNVKWTGEGKLYCKTRKISRDKFNEIEGDHYYRWSDGWGANVEVRQILPSEKRKYDTRSSGFCGYDWMIDSIVKVGKILNSRGE